MKKYFFAVAALALILASCNSGTSNSTQKSEEYSSIASSTEQHQDEHVMLGVKGNCDMCKTRIEKAASDIKGVSSANWNADKQELHLNFDPHQTNLDAISKAIAKVGHDTDKEKADRATYDALPDCCKYRQ